MNDQQPSVGRMVHYVDRVERCCAAVITEVAAYSDEHQAPPIAEVGLCVFGSVAAVYLPLADGGCRFGAVGIAAATGEPAFHPGTWHWPERV